ncbi:MAG: hypothetical protein HYZ53_24960 [Planctomycetes bacterium]|nr:hypothetical protein [Planctomycetota bacterium]
MRDRVGEAAHRFRRGQDNRGYVLLVAMGVLGILAFLSTVFLRMTQVEQSATKTYVDKVRARMMAMAGIERAMGDVRGMEMHQAWLDPRDPWTYKELYTDVEFPSMKGLRTFKTPPKQLEDAVYVSFYDPSRMKNGKGFSGSVGGTYEPDGDTYALKVIDCASQINVNNFDLPAGGAGVPAHPGNANLFKMLNNLDALLEPGVNPPLGTAIQTYVTQRRAQGGIGEFSNKIEIAAALGGNLDRFNKVRDFITCNAWVDKSVVTFNKAGTPRWDLTPRSPININTCTKEVLIACLQGLAANCESPDYKTASYLQRTVPAITSTQAADIADHIIKARYTFGEGADVGKYTFYDWMHFRFTVLDDMIGKVKGVTKEMADMIHANVNPNTDIRKFNPDLIQSDPNPMVARDKITDLDKSDLAAPGWTGTTEWCWSSMGYYEIESLGRVYREGKVYAEEKISTVVKVYDVFRATTQKDFETDRYYSHPYFGSLVTAGGYPAVVSTPEYPYVTGGGYRWKGTDRPIGQEAATDPYCATWDGALMLSGMVKAVGGSNPGKKSFMAGYAKRTIEADQTSYGRTGEPTYSSPLTRVGDSIFYGAAGGGGWWWGGGGGGGVSLGAGEGINWGRIDYNSGSDLHAMGLYMNARKRNRLRSYWGDEFPVPAGTLEFFVKPEVDVSLWGRTIPDVINHVAYSPGPVQLDGRLHLFDWGNVGSSGFSNLAAYNELRIFTSKGRVFAHWRLDDQKDYVLWQDVNWAAHTWHHVEVNWTNSATTTTTGPDGKPVTSKFPGEFMFFVDGNASNPGKLLLGKDIRRNGTNGNVSPAQQFGVNDSWMIIGGRSYNWPDGSSMGCVDFNGTIDNVFVHKWRLHDRSFIPKSRYLDNSLSELVDTGLDKGETVGVYMKRLVDIEKAAKSEDVTLGTISCTHVHSWHIHAATGHTEGKGHLSPGIMMVSGGNNQMIHAYDACSGLGLLKAGGSGQNQAVKKNDELYYVASFERRADLPALTSPILDDFTLTYFTSPKTIYRVIEVTK